MRCQGAREGGEEDVGVADLKMARMRRRIWPASGGLASGRSRGKGLVTTALDPPPSSSTHHGRAAMGPRGHSGGRRSSGLGRAGSRRSSGHGHVGGKRSSGLGSGGQPGAGAAELQPAPCHWALLLALLGAPRPPRRSSSRPALPSGAAEVGMWATAAVR
ncbi:unnamed protein product [Urochloa humidicola]